MTGHVNYDLQPLAAEIRMKVVFFQSIKLQQETVLMDIDSLAVEARYLIWLHQNVHVFFLLYLCIFI